MSESPDLEATEEIPRSSMYDAMLRLAMEPSKREADVRLSEQWTPMPAAELANLLPQWNINAHHNSGFMAAVYRGRQTQPDREVAVKVLRPELRANEEARARFHREGEILAKLVHSNVVQVLEYGDAGADDSAISYLVMVFVHGTSLAERIKHEALPVPLALSLMKQL